MNKISLQRLETCAMDLQIIMRQVDSHFPLVVLEGHRDQVAQDIAYAQGTSKLKWPNSNHNSMPSNAVDVIFDPVDFKDTNRLHYLAGFILGTAIKLKDEGKILHLLRWGGNWKNDNDKDRSGLADLVHFELIPIKE